MQDYQTQALSYAEELYDLKRKYGDLERHCKGLVLNRVPAPEAGKSEGSTLRR